MKLSTADFRLAPEHVRLAITRRAFGLGLCACAGTAAPQGVSTPMPARPAADLNVGEWLQRMQQASRRLSYVGTFVVSSSAGAMSSARIWHASEDQRQAEKVEALTGTPRSTFRRDDEVATFLPEQRLVRLERRETQGLFPELLKSGEAALPEFYAARVMASDRVAGYDADVLQLLPRDNLRFGLRIWSEKRTGLVLKLQTLGTDGEVLEQAAFSELQLDAPLRVDRLLQMMTPPDGWRVERVEAARTDCPAGGWGLRAAVPGFKTVSCWRRRAGAEGAAQWVLSDGLASVSLFVEAFDPKRHTHEGLLASGATQTLTRRLPDGWLTAVGEVPPQTLRAFAQNLERRR